VVERLSFPTTREGIGKVFADRAPARIVLEVGSQSPWMSDLLRSLGHDVIVADARRVAQLTRAGRKTDRRDAETLARLLQGMPELLGAIHHRGREAQTDLAMIRARDVLVRTRTRLVQHVRGTLKVFGLRTLSCSAKAFHSKARKDVPEDLQPALASTSWPISSSASVTSTARSSASPKSVTPPQLVFVRSMASAR